MNHGGNVMKGLLNKISKTAPFIWYRNVLFTLDLMTNAITGGDPRETISSVLGKMQRDGTCKACILLCGFLSIIFMEESHCKNAITPKIGRGTENDWSPIVGLRRRWSNGFVVLLIVMFYYRVEIMDFIINITHLS